MIGREKRIGLFPHLIILGKDRDSIIRGRASARMSLVFFPLLTLFMPIYSPFSVLTTSRVLMLTPWDLANPKAAGEGLCLGSLHRVTPEGIGFYRGVCFFSPFSRFPQRHPLVISLNRGRSAISPLAFTWLMILRAMQVRVVG